VKLIWPSRFNLIKFLFFLTRYLPFFDVSLVLYYQLKPFITVNQCKVTYFPAGWCIVIGIATAEIILVVRTWAIWGRTRKMGLILAAACLVAIVPVLYVENVFLKSLVFSPYPNRATPGCLLTAGSPIIAISFVIIIVFETFLLILTLIKGIQHYRVAGSRGFVTVLYRDGILFYFYLLGFSIVNLIVIIAAPRDLADILATLQRVLHSSLSARVLMNLREARLRELDQLTLSTDTPLRHLTFAHTEDSEQVRILAGRNDSIEYGVMDIS